ncbi:MAG: hypothetical protein GX434_14230 [Peptococcaceae bacterium]|nr:hypothetical protein [Peptococcaceae bacterium]
MNYRTIFTNLGVFLVGLTLFMYEITLTRLFSTLLWYNYVFIIISLAMLGWTIGGIYSFRWLKKIKMPDQEKVAKRKVIILSLLNLTLLGAILFLYKVPYSGYLIPVYIVLSTLPFILGGYYLSLSFKESAKRSNILYFADLLGSALGSVMVVLLLDNFSLIRIGFILGLIPLLAASLSLSVIKIKVPASLMVVGLMVLTFTSGSILDSWAQDFSAFNGSPKVLSSFKERPRIVYTFWNSLARTDVVEQKGDNNKWVLVDGGAISEMVAYNGDLKTVQYLKNDVGYFPFAYKKNNSALLIGPGGGQDILYAHLGGVHDITAVEINPGSVEAAKKFKDMNGNIYGQQGTRVYVRDGRSFITRDQNKYDVIFLSKVMTQSSETLGYALSENYIYTKQAYEAYLNHLNPDGTLALVLHNASNLGKATATLLQIFEERGIPRDQAVKYMTVVNSTVTDGQMHGANMIMYPLLMVKNMPFTSDESKKIISLAEQSGQQIISLPNEHEMLKAITPSSNQQRSYLVTDNYPFFYNPGHSAPAQILIMLLVVLLIGYLLTGPSLIREKDNHIKYFKAYFAYIVSPDKVQSNKN